MIKPHVEWQPSQDKTSIIRQKQVQNPAANVCTDHQLTKKGEQQGISRELASDKPHVKVPMRLVITNCNHKIVQKSRDAVSNSRPSW